MKLKKTTLNLKTKSQGMIPVIAYAIGNTGLYVHRILDHNLKQTDMNYWQISTASGYRVVSMLREPITRKALLNKVVELFQLNWNKPDTFWYTGEARQYIDLASRVAVRL